MRIFGAQLWPRSLAFVNRVPLFACLGRNWLGGLDSNQDTQIQSLMSYQLDDLPAAGGKRNGL